MDDLKILSTNPLFSNISQNEIALMLKCFKAVKTFFTKGETIYNVGDKISSIGIILSGSVHIVKYDIWGNSHIIQRIDSGGFFAETYACQKNITCLVDVITAQDSEVLFINADKIIKNCPACCSFHQTIAGNLLTIIAQKNFSLIKKIELITPKSLRERVFAYLSQTKQPNETSFDIPFDRQQLADYLCVDRSALSAELSKMKKEGLIDYHKNHFELKLHP